MNTELGNVWTFPCSSVFPQQGQGAERGASLPWKPPSNLEVKEYVGSVSDCLH